MDYSHCHTGSYDCLIVQLVVIWRTCDRSAMFATISRSARILRSVFFGAGRSSYDWSYAWSRDQHRLEKIDDMIHHIVGNRTTSVAINDRSYDQSWLPTIDRTINRGILREQSIGGATGRKVARPVARLIVRPLTIWNSKIPIRCLWTAFCVPLSFIFYEKQ